MVLSFESLIPQPLIALDLPNRNFWPAGIIGNHCGNLSISIKMFNNTLSFDKITKHSISDDKAKVSRESCENFPLLIGNRQTQSLMQIN